MHAYLVVGKTMAARRQKAEELLSGVTEKIILTTPKNRHQIAEIRQLRRRLSLRITLGQTRGVLIEEAQLLTSEAANALLKTLEEPPGKTLVVLTAPNAQVVLPTIVSRCLNLDLGPQVREISPQDKENAQKLWQKLATGGVGEKMQLVDQLLGKDEALSFLIGQIFQARVLLLEKPSRALADLLEIMEQARADLEGNVNPKLAIANLLLHYPTNFPLA